MPVDTKHSLYGEHAALWAKCRDVAAGQEAVHAAGETYLPKLGGQDRDEYAAYKGRALFYNATARTIDGLSGMIFRKEPLVPVPEAMEPWLSDIDMAGQPFVAFAEKVVQEQLEVSRCGILVDYPPMPEGVQTRTQAERAGLRPFLSLYRAEDVINWRTGRVSNRTEVTRVVLREVAQEQSEKDEFLDVEVEQYRVLELGESGYFQRVYRENGKGEWEQWGEDIVPLMNGRPLPYIPFLFVGPRDMSPEPTKPVLLDLVNVNISHYKTTADLEHGAHFTALPTPYCFGVNEEETPSAIGPTVIWSGSSTDVQVGYLEFTGQGLETLNKRLAEKEEQMASIGARMLSTPKRVAEAAQTEAIRSGGEHGVLASMANSVSWALTRALEIMRDWAGFSGDVSVELNTDYLPAQMDAQTLTALVQASQAGKISMETLYYNLQRGEIVAPGRTYEDEQDAIEQDGAQGLNMAAFPVAGGQ